MIMISEFFFNPTSFCVIVYFLTELLKLGILFSTAVNAIFVVKLLTSGILSSNSVSFVSLTIQSHQKFCFPILLSLFDI